MNKLNLAGVTGTLISLILISACGPTAEEKAAQESIDRGKELLSEIEKANENRDYERVLMLCDSLDRSCPRETDLRKKALVIWTNANVSLLNDSATMVDLMIDSLTHRMNVLMPEFVQVAPAASGLDGHRICKSIPRSGLVARTGAEPRLGGQDDLWVLVVNTAGVKPGITGLRLIADGTTVAETTAQNAAERRAIGSTDEMFSFNAEEADPIARAITEHGPGVKYQLEVVGKHRNVKIVISPALADAISKTREMAVLREQRANLLKKRELLSRKIEVAESYNNPS